MIDKLGSVPFCKDYVMEETVGHWAIENDPGKEPRMYADDIMLRLIGLEKPVSPEETYKAWKEGIDKSYMDSVLDTERMNVNGLRAEVQYPWHYPDGRTVLIRCEGVRNYDYKDGIRTEGRHRNITELIHLQKEAAIINALTLDFDCVNYVVINEDKTKDIAIPFRTSERLKAIIPNWENEVNFHNRLELLVESVGYEDEDINHFYEQTRREVILAHLEKDPVYFVNTRAELQKGVVEYFQFKFIADRDREGKIIGFVVGIHSINDIMLAELEYRNMEQQLADTLRLANTDSLTKVKSLSAYREKLATLSKQMSEDENLEFAIVMCDCDNLKQINDGYGHDIGDKYICNTSAEICGVFSHSPVYRIGGDEFVIILQGADYQNRDKLMEEIKDWLEAQEEESSIPGIPKYDPQNLSRIQAGGASFSHGIAVFDRSKDDTVGSVIKRADMEMYHMKNSKKDK